MLASSREVRAVIQTYVLCTFGLGVVFYVLLLATGGPESAGGLYAFGLMWCPAAGALITCLVRDRSLSSLGWEVKPKYLRLGYTLPILYAGIAYAIVWLTGLGGFPNRAFIDSIAAELGVTGLPGAVAFIFYVGIAATAGVIRSAAIALGAEIGWRGLLVPELFKVTSFTGTALISGALWAVWSIPLLTFADSDGPVGWGGVMCFATMTIGLSFLYTWLRLRSDSLWAGVALHASHNVFVQSIFTPMTTQTANAARFIDETGYALALGGIVVAVVVWRRRHVFDKPRIEARQVVASPLHEVILRSTARSTLRSP